MKSGIYLIKNTISGKLYVGSSKSMWDRWRNHRSDLRRGKHTNCHLLAAWVRYGEDAFSFDVLEYCAPEDRMAREDWWINLLGTRNGDKGYNITEARPGGGMRGRQHSPETKAKQSAAAKGKKKSSEHCANLAAVRRGTKMPEAQLEKMKGGTPWNKGKTGVFSDETRGKMAAAKAGKTLTPEHRAKVLAAMQPGGVPWNKGIRGVPLSPEHREKVLAALRPGGVAWNKGKAGGVWSPARRAAYEVKRS